GLRKLAGRKKRKLLAIGAGGVVSEAASTLEQIAALTVQAADLPQAAEHVKKTTWDAILVTAPALTPEVAEIVRQASESRPAPRVVVELATAPDDKARALVSGLGVALATQGARQVLLNEIARSLHLPVAELPRDMRDAESGSRQQAPE